MNLWWMNGCNLFRQSHAFNWSGSTTHNEPTVDIKCGCEAFVMKAHSGEIVPSEQLKVQMDQAQAMLAEAER